MTAEIPRSASAFVVTVEFELEAGAHPQFLDMVRENAAESVRSEEGCIRFDVLTPLAATGPAVLLYEIYTSRAAFDLHLASAHFKAFDAMTRQMVRSKTVAEFAIFEYAKYGVPA